MGGEGRVGWGSVGGGSSDVSVMLLYSLTRLHTFTVTVRISILTHVISDTSSVNILPRCVIHDSSYINYCPLVTSSLGNT